MKKIVFSTLLSCSISFSFAQTLFTYGNKAVDKEEFLRAYNKNKNPNEDKEKALKEYLELYTRFKLKVRAAMDMKLDTLPQLVSDLQNFRSQVDETYMNNDDALNVLIDEAFEHSLKDLHVIHFFTPVNSNTSAADSAKAVKAMQEVSSSLQSGNNDYNKIAADATAKFTTVKASDIGYITAFTVPYDYEKIIYGLKNGEACKPYTAKNGIHIFKVVGERNAMGKWRIAQILIAIPPGGEENVKQSAHKADSVYALLKAGADFGEMAKEFSDDKLTYMSAGQMPEFTTGKFDQAFEEQVFKLTKDEEISKPFQTPYGFHIVKRIAVIPVVTNKNDATNRYEIKQKIMQDSRVNAAKESFTAAVVKQIGYKRTPQVKDAELFRYADSVAANPAINGNKEYPISNKIIFTGNKSNVKGKDWLNFIKEYKSNPEIYKGESNRALLDKFVTVQSLAYYKNNLDEYNPEFKHQMEEFREGNLLFEVMERKVWSSASSDTVGLLKYYNEHKGKYLWNASGDVIIFSCTNKKAAEAAVAALNNGKPWKKIAEESNMTIQADSGRYEIAQMGLAEGVKATAGLITPVMVNPSDGSAGFIKIVKLHPANEQRTFEEARGLVINDYQTVLEEKWVEELKKKYPVKVDEAVFQSLLK
ncbi:MAG: peptidylprolyl isomerase [Bacteroidetes bacterium]|nr:peptidylprolyl isomerase [Bacteroidota bacterium]